MTGRALTEVRRGYTLFAVLFASKFKKPLRVPGLARTSTAVELFV